MGFVKSILEPFFLLFFAGMQKTFNECYATVNE